MAANLKEATYRATVNAAGRVVIPAPIRNELGIQAGQNLLMRVVAGHLEITTQEAALRRIQAIAHKHRGRRKGLVSEELIRERREAAKRGD